jgi:IPT/TIG domain
MASRFHKSQLLVLIALLFALPALAAPAITSVTPSTGAAGGGETVIIHGTGFSACIICSPPVPPQVFFGGAPAASVFVESPTRLRVVTPALPARTVPVTVDQFDGQATLENAYTFSGNFTATMEPILVPVFTPPTRGAFGSEFRTTVSAAHKGNAERILLYGLDTSCFLFSPVLGPTDPRIVAAGGPVLDLPADCSTGPARLFYVPANLAQHITFNARVRDVSRSDLGFGAEVPIVRLSDLTTESVVLLNVPIDARYRNTLRIYGVPYPGVIMPPQVLVNVNGRETTVTLTPGRDEFEPAYAVFTDFPTVPEANGPDRMRVTITPLTPIVTPPPGTLPIWAFITVTNNSTQEITTVTPD